MTDDELRALVDAAMPGPWAAAGEVWSRIVYSSGVNRVCFMAHSNGLNDARDLATSALVAAAPDLAAEVLRLRAKEAAGEKLAEEVSDMIIIATSDRWGSALTGRQMVLKSARSALAAWGALK